jgi:hypothetical protein
MKVNKGNIDLLLSQLHEFDGVLEYTPFDWKVPMTYLSACIRFFQGKGIYSHVKEVLMVTQWLLDYAKAHNIDTHNAKIGDLCIIEALEEGVCLDFDIKNNLINMQLCFKRNDLIKTLITDEETEEYRQRAYFTIGKKYDVEGCLLAQLIYQVSEKLDKPISEIIGSEVDLDTWIGTTGESATKKFYCSKVHSYIHLPSYPNFYEIAPSDIYTNQQEETIVEGFVKTIN